MEIRIETSARHIHLTAEDYHTLFGEKDPTKVKELSQKDMACEESVTIEGPKSSLSNVRIIVPFRERTQLEISKTDCFAIGVDAPLRISGSFPGADIKIKGPEGVINKDVAIVAKRHLHLSLSEAAELALSNDDIVKVEVSGDRSLVFSSIPVRVKDTFTMALHLDTDEANAAGISNESIGDLIINKDLKTLL